MAKKVDPFEDFAKKMLSSPKVSDATVPVEGEKDDTVKETKEPDSAEVVAEQPEVDSPTAEIPGKKEKLTDDYVRTSFHIKKDLMKKLRIAGFNSETSVKALVNIALEEFLQNHPDILE